MPAGAVRIVLTSVILSGGSFLPSATGAGCWAEPSRLAHSQGRPSVPAPIVDCLSHWRRFMEGLLVGEKRATNQCRTWRTPMLRRKRPILARQQIDRGGPFG